MQEEVRIALLGEYVLMEGIYINLKDDSSVVVARSGTDRDAALQLVARFRPQVIVYERSFTDIEEVLSHASLSCCVRLMILDGNRNQVLVMDSKLLNSPTMADLQQLLSHPAPEGPRVTAPADVQEKRVLGNNRAPDRDTLPN
jgi:hypothetical protein